MARILTLGFEMQSLLAPPAEALFAGSPTLSSTTVRSGTRALRISGMASTTAMSGRFVYAAANSAVDYYVRFYLRIATLPSAANQICRWNASAGGGLAWITLDNGGLLRLFDEDGQVGSASSALSTGIWYRIEMRFNTAPASGSHVVEGMIDGSVFATSSTRALSSGGNTFRVGGNLAGEAQTQGDWCCDDIALNNASGTAQNTYPGAGSIVHLHVDGTGDNDAAWTRGGADSGANWSQVEEITPNDVTDYLIGDTNADLVDFAVEAASAAGIGAADTITLVEVVAQVRALTAAVCSHRERIKSLGTGAGGTTVSGTTIQIADATTFHLNDDGDPKRGQLVQYTDPQAGGAWTPALLDTMQIGIEAVDAAPDVLCSALQAIVEYNPAVAVIAPPAPTALTRQAVPRSQTR